MRKFIFLISKLSITLLSVITILNKRWYWALSLEQAGVRSRLMLMTDESIIDVAELLAEAHGEIHGLHMLGKGTYRDKIDPGLGIFADGF